MDNAAYLTKVDSIVAKAAFIGHLGISFTRVDEGVCESEMPIQPWQLQQNGFVHAGVLATMADHTAGGAVAALLGDDEGVLTIEFKINLLRPAVGDRLMCRAEVLRHGRSVSVIESGVYFFRDGAKKLAAKATVTLAIVADTTL